MSKERGTILGGIMTEYESALWQLPQEQSKTVKELQKQLQINEILARLLVNRGYTQPIEVQRFIRTESQDLLDPFALKDMEKAVERIHKAIIEAEKIVVYGDYDVDGITASALLYQFLQSLGSKVQYYIPERFTEGYGLNDEALRELYQQGDRLLITVDCGISAQHEVNEVPQDFDIIITDHHEPPEELPRAYAIINPKQKDCHYPEKGLAGVGLAFKLCQALYQTLSCSKTANPERWIDLAALGTVADMAPLMGENRTIVKLGLAQMNQRPCLGIGTMLKVAGLSDQTVTAQTIGFILGPRLNASGRLTHAKKAVELLTTQDEAIATAIAEELEEENRERQALTRQIFQQADQYLLEQKKLERPILVAWGPWDSEAGSGWHPGVIGIVASRLVEKYYRPVVLMSIEKGIAKGSCRSISAFNIFEALQGCDTYLVKYGGHAAAAGLTVEEKNLTFFEAELIKYAEQMLKPEDLRPCLSVDTFVALTEVNDALMESLAALEPCGYGNPPPVLACRNIEVDQVRQMGQTGDHVRAVLKNDQDDESRLPLIAFGRGKQSEWLQQQKKVDVAFKAEYNYWKGQKNIQLLCKDWRIPVSSSPIDRLFQENEASSDLYHQIEEAESFYTKLAGVTFENRQQLIEQLDRGCPLVLVREPHNEFDPSAIQVCLKDGSVLGYLNRRLAHHLAPVMDEGRMYQGVVSDITGRDQSSLGVNVQIFQVPVQHEPLKRPILQQGENWDDKIRQSLLGSNDYHKVQKEALQSLAQGKSTLVIMGTGRGKSAIFQTHAAKIALEQQQMTLIVYPLRALVNDQLHSLTEKFSPLGLRVLKGNGTLSDQEKVCLFEELSAGSIDVLLATPEFIAAYQDKFQAIKEKIGFFVIDECHHIAMSGKRQRPVYQKIGKLLENLGNPLTLAVTATADDKTYELLESTLPLQTILIDPTVRKNLSLTDGRSEMDKLNYLVKLAQSDSKVLIYVNSRRKAIEVAEKLRSRLPRKRDEIGFYHGGLSNLWRQEVENWFRNGTLKVLVATSAFGEGIDLPDIRHVVLYHLPFHKTAFNQQCGRAGRDGQPSTIHLLFNEQDVELNQFILSNRALRRNQIGPLYLVLKGACHETGFTELSNPEIADILQKKYKIALMPEGISLGLRIMEDLNLIQRERQGAKRKIYLKQVPKEKQDLAQSVTYLEGLEEEENFLAFAEEVMKSDGMRLLSWLNRPVYPQKLADG